MTFLDALGAAKGAFDLVAVAIKARDDTKVQAAMADLREKLWEMSTNGFSQMQELHRLELEVQKSRMELVEARREKADLEAKVKEKTQYEFFEIVPGGWAYTTKADIDKPVHKRANFCAACNSDSKVVPLQHLSPPTHETESWYCPVDKSHTLVHEEPGVTHDRETGVTTIHGF
ncbi:hypothetical protein [Comamonas sp. lk]|uniref:hypothetical protein n=1 Tax=Comamonas sp. lk TaxID=2201272 RepID=UPI000EB2AD4D|nr:hypothetical protein [Comamonas sp. lk]